MNTEYSSGRLFAESAALFARATAKVSWTRRLVHGTAPQLRVREWHVAHTAANEIDFPVVVPGDPQAPRLPLPARYPTATRIVMPDWVWTKPWAWKEVAHPAVAWQLGSAVMYGEIDHRQLPRLEDGRYAFWMRRGVGAVAVAPVFHMPVTNEIWLAPPHYAGTELLPLAELGETVNVADLPADAVLY